MTDPRLWDKAVPFPFDPDDDDWDDYDELSGGCLGLILALTLAAVVLPALAVARWLRRRARRW